MGKKRKISIRKVLRAFVTFVAATGSVLAVLSASKIQQTKTLRNITLHVRNDSYKFLDRQALWDKVVIQQELKKGKTKLSGLDIRKVERAALSNQWVAEAQAYVDNNRDMHIYVTQRVPVARIFFDNGQSFYLDASLRLLPLSDLFTYYTTIVTNVPVLSNDSLNKNLRSQIIRLVKFVERDSFWSAQIAQIDVTHDLKFELTPVLGTHKIVFGDTSDMQEKFNNLFAFYKKVLNRIGWDRYEILDVRYSGQVVASPTIPWKPPTRNAISNMDWVKNIMDDMTESDKKPVAVQQVPVQKTQVFTTGDQSKKMKEIAEKKKESQTNKKAAQPVGGKYIYQGN